MISMKTLILMTLLVFASCTHHQEGRIPSSNSALDNEIMKMQKKLERLEEIRYAHNTEVFVDFIDAGKVSKGKYLLRAKVYSNNIQDIEKAYIELNGDHAWDLVLRDSHSEKLIDETVPFFLPLGKTFIKFKLKNGEIREVELECTKLGACI
jgi:hypothetical protein